MKLINIEATTLPDAWFTTIYNCVENGREFVIDQGSYTGQKRLEFDYLTVRVKMPWIEPLEPQIPEQYNIPNPVQEGYLDDYLPYLMTGKKKEGESYTYGSRLTEHPISYSVKERENKDIFISEPNIVHDKFLNQMELLIWTYKNKGHRNNQMCMQVAEPGDMLLNDPCCLRHVDTRVQDNTLHFFPYFRSWDIFSGLPANLGALELMKQYIASEIGVENGEIIVASKGAHIYDYCFQLAEILRGKTIQEFQGGK